MHSTYEQEHHDDVRMLFDIIGLYGTPYRPQQELARIHDSIDDHAVSDNRDDTTSIPSASSKPQNFPKIKTP